VLEVHTDRIITRGKRLDGGEKCMNEIRIHCEKLCEELFARITHDLSWLGYGSLEDFVCEAVRLHYESLLEAGAIAKSFRVLPLQQISVDSKKTLVIEG